MECPAEQTIGALHMKYSTWSNQNKWNRGSAKQTPNKMLRKQYSNKALMDPSLSIGHEARWFDVTMERGAWHMQRCREDG